MSELRRATCAKIGRHNRRYTEAKNTVEFSTEHPSYQAWENMLKRARRGYASVCERWLDFANFIADMGARPEGLTLERVENSKGYRPGNVIWTTHKQQSTNRKITHWLEYEGVRKCLTDWAHELGLARSTVLSYINYGCTLEDLFAQYK